MPWSFPWSEYVKKRACRYLLQHYLGQFLKEKLTLDQLSVNLSSGKGNITQLDLNVESVNEALESSNIPLEVVDGFIHEISISVPWTCLIQKSTELEITGLELTLQPKQISQNGGGLESMFSSTMSMTSSLKIAEDCLKPTEENFTEDTSQPYEGVQIFAQTIDSVLSRVKVTLNDTVIRVEHLPMQAETGVALEIRIKRIEYFDDLALDEGSSSDDLHKWEPSAISHKNISIEGVQIFSDEFSRLSRQSDSSDLGSEPASPTSPSIFHSTSSTLSSVSPVSQPESTKELPSADSDPIQIAVVTGKNSLKVKVKQGDGIQGPKVEMECELGALHIFLCPKQFHSLWELAEGLSSPATNDRKIRKNRSKSKPMSPDDYRKIEEDLQRQLQSGRVQHQRHEISQFTAMHDIMTGSFGGEDQFYAIGQNREMESSFTSQTSYSSVSTVRSSGTEHKRSKDPMKKILDDPSAELSHYRLRLAFFSVALLHDNPSSNVEHGQTKTQESNIKDLSKNYFQKVFTIATAARGDMKAVRKSFAEILKYDHIRILGKPLTIDCTQKTISTHQTMNVDVTVGMFELVECLFDRRDKTATPTYTELLVFQREENDHVPNMYSSMHGGTPCIKASIVYIEQTKGSRKMNPRTDINFNIGACESEIDVTIVDRVSSLIRPPPRSRSSSNTGHMPVYSGVPDTFSQTMEDGAGSSEMTTDIIVNSPSVKLYLRFPIPDLRPASQVDRFPWWQKNLREEMLILKLSDFRFLTSLKSQQSVLQLDVMCKDVHGSFLLDPNHEPEPFAFASGDGDSEDGFNSPQFTVKISNKVISLLDEQNMNSDNSTPLDSLNGACQFERVQPSPFSNKKSMYGKDDDGGNKEEDGKHISEEMIIPGDREEMSEFQETCLNNTEITLDISLPLANVYLPNKHFYEVLYNRINNDLLLWEPVAPAPLPTQDQTLGSIQPFDLSCYPQVLQDNFELAKSAIQYDSSDEEEDYSYNYYSIHDSKYPRRQQTNENQPCKMCLLLRIDKGKLTTTFDSKVENCQGAAVALLQNANLFTVSYFKGDPSLQYICFYSNQVELYHSGAVSTSEDFSLVPSCENISYIPACLKKCRTIYPTEPGVTRLDFNNMDMLSVAVKIKKDTTAMNDLTRDEKVKEFLVSLAVHGATLRHKMVESGCSWISQLIGLLDVKDYEVMGYIAPKVLTELHVHLWKCAVDYRPVFHPTKAIVKAETFSISSNIVAESSTSLLRFVLDDASLFLSQSVKSTANLHKDYVCVADLERFELALRMNDGKDQKLPKTDLKVSTNRLNIRTCSDSCKALMELIQYFSSDGDLHGQEPDDLNSTGTSDDIMSTDTSQLTIEDEEDDDKSRLSESRMEQLHTLVEDAMQESGTVSSPERESSSAKTEVFFTTEGTVGDVPPAGMMRPIVISASIDSVTSTCSGVSETFSDDEDFCIIDDPGIGIAPKDGEPCVRVFTTEVIEIKENYFSQPLGKTDLLKAPNHYPLAEYRYTLKELTVVWYMYGGKDLSDVPKTASIDKDATISFKPEKSDSKQQITMGYRPRSSTDRSSIKVRGGPGRDHDVVMELQLSKIRLQHETYPSHTEQASRQILVISDVEIRDRLAVSNINKLLYQYSSETLPKQTNANMVLIKAVHLRPDPSSNSQECSLRVSVQPLRLNIDQDSLLFMRQFFTELSGGTVEQTIPQEESESKPRSRTPSGASASSPPPPVMNVGVPEPSEEVTDPQELLMMFDEVQDIQMKTSGDGDHGDHTPRSLSADQISEPATHPVFIKSFIFSPDVPIRLDYHGKKHVNTEQSTLIGLLSGLAQLNCSELQLKRLTYRHGLLGLDKLVAYCVNEWLTDIKKNQLASVFGGVGPMYSFVQLAQGIKDLFWLPVEQYRKDGRIVRGLQRGASSFSTSTALAFLELTNRVVQTVQYVAEFTYDMVSPGPSVRIQGHRRRKKYGRQGQPSDLREGFSNAYVVLREGLSEQAQNFVESASTEHEQKGVTGVVGGVMRQIPSAVISPLIIGPDALSNVLGGARNQLRPDAKKEDEEKWKFEPT